MGAPNTDVTVLIASSTGEKSVRAKRSQNIQNTAPHRNVVGITTIGLAVFKSILVICGTAMPTNDIGPAKAVTHAERRLEHKMRTIRKARMLTPMFCAYPSPSWYASMGLDMKKDVMLANRMIIDAIFRLSHVMLPKLPIDHDVRFAMSASLAKVTHRSVTAEQI